MRNLQESSMQTIQIAELKARFSEILKHIQNEKEEYVIQYGRKHKKVAVIIPYETYAKNTPKIKLGLLKNKVKNKANYEIKSDFEITEDELLGVCSRTVAVARESNF